MSKMNQLSIEEQEAAYDSYVEEQRQELRKEGAEELRNDIMRELEYSIAGATDDGVRYGLVVAMEYVKRAFI